MVYFHAFLIWLYYYNDRNSYTTQSKCSINSIDTAKRIDRNIQKLKIKMKDGRQVNIKHVHLNKGA